MLLPLQGLQRLRPSRRPERLLRCGVLQPPVCAVLCVQFLREQLQLRRYLRKQRQLRKCLRLLSVLSVAGTWRSGSMDPLLFVYIGSVIAAGTFRAVGCAECGYGSKIFRLACLFFRALPEGGCAFACSPVRRQGIPANIAAAAVRSARPVLLQGESILPGGHGCWHVRFRQRTKAPAIRCLK